VNTFQFFNQNFGQYLTEQTNQPHMDAWRALSSTHPMRNSKGEMSSGRLASGWAIIRPGNAVTQLKLTLKGIKLDDRTRFEAFSGELEAWDGTPRIFLIFDKAPLPIANLFMTLDLRAVRICSPAGVETFDYTKSAPKSAGVMQRNLEKQRSKNVT
jgi:hypothetical protein